MSVYPGNSKITKNIVLIGFMGSGKSTVSHLLSRRLSRRCISLDAMIEEKEQRSIKDIFAQLGEAYFRRIEKEMVRRIALESFLIIDTGGGIVLDPENIALLKQNGILFYLDATEDTIYRRLQNDQTRPLLQGSDPRQNIKKLIEQRLPQYIKAADHVIDANDDEALPAMNEILKRI